jgi:type II secretion system protein H
VVQRALGFTLVEILVVVMVMAIIAGIAVPMMSDSQDAQCAAAARTLTADLEMAQSTALAQQAQVALVFSPDLKKYKVVLAAGQTLTNYASLTPITNPFNPGQTYEVSLASELQVSRLVIQTASFGVGASTYVVFDSFGSPTNGGNVRLKVRDAVLTVTVAPITGAISVS